MHDLTRTVAVIEAGIERKLHLGVQVALVVDGQAQGLAMGEAEPGMPLTSEMAIPWLSAGKPVTAVAIATLVDAGKISFDDVVSKYISEFGQGGKEGITIGNLLTHTAGLSPVDVDWSTTSWDDIIRSISEQPAREGWTVGKDAGYDPVASWFLLGDVIQRVSGRDLETYLKEEIFEPVGMTGTSVRGSGEVDFAPLYDRVGGQMQVSPYTARLAKDHVAPGSSLRGPAADLAKFYQHLLEILDGHLGLISQGTLKNVLTRHRRETFDQTLQHQVDYGYGFILDSNRYGVDTVPYGFGRHASETAFGHGGSQSSMGFADPRYKLAAGVIANGRAGEGQHQRRFRELLTALYEDLGLSGN